MKKMTATVLAASIALGMGAACSLSSVQGCNYTDVNNDGICDNYISGTCPQNNISAGRSQYGRSVVSQGRGYGCHGGYHGHCR